MYLLAHFQCGMKCFWRHPLTDETPSNTNITRHFSIPTLPLYKKSQGSEKPSKIESSREMAISPNSPTKVSTITSPTVEAEVLAGVAHRSLLTEEVNLVTETPLLQSKETSGIEVSGIDVVGDISDERKTNESSVPVNLNKTIERSNFAQSKTFANCRESLGLEISQQITEKNGGQLKLMPNTFCDEERNELLASSTCHV